MLCLLGISRLYWILFLNWVFVIWCSKGVLFLVMLLLIRLRWSVGMVLEFIYEGFERVVIRLLNWFGLRFEI